MSGLSEGFENGTNRFLVAKNMGIAVFSFLLRLVQLGGTKNMKKGSKTANNDFFQKSLKKKNVSNYPQGGIKFQT